LGFRFFKKHWNQGYATEAALSCLEYALIDLGLTKIIGRAMQENAASIQVLKKIGFKTKEPCSFDGKQALLFEIEKQNYSLKK
jgi:RimJ/RimL family protein N-acetyltransferase